MTCSGTDLEHYDDFCRRLYSTKNGNAYVIYFELNELIQNLDLSHSCKIHLNIYFGLSWLEISSSRSHCTNLVGLFVHFRDGSKRTLEEEDSEEEEGSLLAEKPTKKKTAGTDDG